MLDNDWGNTFPVRQMDYPLMEMKKVNPYARRIRRRGQSDSFSCSWKWACVLLMVFVGIVVPVACPAAEGEEGNDAALSAELVWARSDGHDYEIFISFYRDGSWSAARQITDNSENDIVPAVIRDHLGRLWVVWSKLEDGARTLYFKTSDGKEWSAEQKIETGYTVNLSAGLAVDRENQIWLVWSSFDGVDDDIFFSTWDQSGWSKPMRVNTNDSTPDIQPVIGIERDGLPWVRWSGFEDGEYHTFESRWNGNDWTAERMLTEPGPPTTASADSSVQPDAMGNTPPTQIQVMQNNGPSKMIPLPESLADPWKAGICLDENGRVSSMPLRMLLEEDETRQ